MSWRASDCPRRKQFVTLALPRADALILTRALTIRAIDNLRATSARIEKPDGLIAGLYIIVQPSGAKSWAVRYRHSGRPRKLTLGTYPGISLSSARELARRSLLAVAEGKDPCREKKNARRQIDDRSRDLFANIAADFVERHAKANTRESSWRETQRLFNRDVLPLWKNKTIQEITRRDVIELLDRVHDRGSPIMANRVLAAVRRMFGWCVDRGVIETSPCAGLRAPAAERSRDRVLTDHELCLVWMATEEIGWPFGPLVKLLILTAQRLNEVSRMRWSEIDLGSRVWIIPRERTKNDLAHEVPLSPQALEVISKLPRVCGNADLVFTTTGETPVGGFSRAKNRIEAALGREGSNEPLLRWTFHDLRRTAASGMARLGVNLPVIEKVLNHTSGSFAGVVGVYQRYSFSEEKRIALELWDRFVAQLVTEFIGRRAIYE